MTSKSNSEETECNCNHLTHFAVLFDYGDTPKVISNHFLKCFKHYSSINGCGALQLTELVLDFVDSIKGQEAALVGC